jgi:hypothetical protein
MREEAEQRQGPNQSGSSEHESGILEGGRAEGIIAAVPAFLVGVLLLASVWWDSAFDLRYWAPLTILTLALLLAQTLAGGLSLPRRGPLAVGLVAIWCLAALVLLSAAWSESPVGAWEGGARALFYAAVFTVAVAAARGGEWTRWLGAGLLVGIAAIAIVVLLRVFFEGADAFLAGRLNAPAGYRNGTAALFAFAVWPLIGIAARRGLASGGRAGAFAGVALLLGLAFMTQSRGVLLGLVAGGAVSLLIGPDRVRRAWLAIAAAFSVALVSGGLLEPFHAFDSGAGTVADADAHRAGVALLLIVGATFISGLLLAVLDNGLRVDLRARIRAQQIATAGLAALAVLACAVAIGQVGDPVTYAGNKLDEFTSLEADTTGTGGVRLGTVSGQRYDLYGIAWNEFLESPLAGAGEGSYSFDYYRDRRTDRNLSNPHSLPLRLLAGTGLLGFGLFLIWLTSVGLAIASRVRGGTERERLWVAGLSAAGTTVLAQASVDWLWLLPGLFGLAVLALGLAAAGGEREGQGNAADAGGGWSVGRAAGALGLAAALAGVTLLFLSDFYVRKARVEARSSPAAALEAARTAERLNPVSITPLYLQASALESQGRREQARAALRKALDLERRNFVTLGLLGDLEVRAGNDRRARVYYRASLELNPRDVGLRELAQGGE